MKFLDKYTKSEIEDIVSQSKNFTEVLIKMNRSINSGSNRMLLTQYIKDNNIDISHFKESIHKWTAKEIFVENSLVTQNVLREHYKKGNYSEYKCAICGMLPVWNGNPITLILDHINGVGNDNRLHNLRWICANCDRQLPTYGTKKMDNKFFCKKCRKELNKKSKTGLCAECYAKVHYSGNPRYDACPICGAKKKFVSIFCRKCRVEQDLLKKKESLGFNRHTLKELIRNNSITKLSQIYPVTRETLKKWCQEYNLPTNFHEIQSYSDFEWQLI